jgi:hypothetical protein
MMAATTDRSMPTDATRKMMTSDPSASELSADRADAAMRTGSVVGMCVSVHVTEFG